ncbi:MAG: aminoacyl-tRNA hydrolase, partial [Candidatus Omnitrophica bacterium]|nr:aminoacyl-tRNA hydrolase [Candidatus Omnitrophota bacterium]
LRGQKRRRKNKFSSMKVIVGLGNPGIFYAHTRHNIGSSVVKALCRVYKIKLARDKYVSCYTAKTRIDGEELILAIPATFMNLSGEAVGALFKRYKVPAACLLVICDDLDLDFGRLKIRPGGSSGGHRGLASIIEALEVDDFCRLRIGIGRPPGKMDPADYVLRNFSRTEKAGLGDIVQQACLCCQEWASAGITKTMSLFNTRR